MESPWTVAETLDCIKPLLREDLVPAGSFSRITEAAGFLPGASTSYFLECRLTHGNPRIDFGACFRSPRDGVAGTGSEAAGPGPFTELFSYWRNGKSYLSRHVPYLWLELDEAQILSGSSLPGFLFCVHPGMARIPGRFGDPVLPAAGLLGVAHEAAEILAGSALDPGIRRALLTCSAFLSGQGRILHVSVMPYRSPPAVKLNIALPKQDLMAFLGKIGWPGFRPRLQRIWNAFHPCMAVAKIDLEMKDGLTPAIGLELHPYNSSQAGRRRALGRLEALGMADPGKCRALAAWSRPLLRTFRGHSWPTRLMQEFGLKLALDGAGRVEAKGYLGFYPIFVLH